MTRSARSHHSPPSCTRSNLLALLIAFIAVSVLYIDVQPTPAGADTASNVVVIPEAVIVPPTDPPASPESPASDEEHEPATLADDQPPPPLTPAERLAATVDEKIELLERGAGWLERIPDYTAQFFKQELIDGRLQDEQVVFMKVRHNPFSVYMKWLVGDKGREVLYVSGSNDGKMIVHAGGWKARLPALKLDPTGSLAMSESRHPITKAGLLELTRLLLEYRRDDMEKNLLADCRKIEGQSFNDRPCCCFVVEYASPELSPDYRKSIAFIDCEWSIPVCVKNFSWPPGEIADDDPAAIDEATLIETYSYSDLKFNQQLADIDFDKSNTDYTFRR